jgi:stalled ribosome rescue protein Dom34
MRCASRSTCRRVPSRRRQASRIELAAAARTILDEVYERELSATRDDFERRFSHDRASTDVATVARAATYGAVDTLLVDIDEKVPGLVDEDTGAVAFAEDDASSYGVVDEIARRVLLSGGRVLAVRGSDVPAGGPVAAMLRYPL